MHTHKMFTKVHKKQRRPPLHEMFHGKHGFGRYLMPEPQQLGPHKMDKLNELGSHMKHNSGHKPHIRGHHKVHPLMFQRRHHGKHGKLHHKKHYRRQSFSSSSSSSESEDEFLVEEHRGKRNPKDCSPNNGHPHKEPSPNMFQILHGPHGRPLHNSQEMMNHVPEPGEVLPFMKPIHRRMYHMKHKIGHHKMHPRKFHKRHEMGHHITHKSGRGGHGHHMMQKTEGALPMNGIHFHKMHHHKMHKKHHHMKHRGRSSFHSSTSSSDSEKGASLDIYRIKSGDKQRLNAESSLVVWECR